MAMERFFQETRIERRGSGRKRGGFAHDRRRSPRVMLPEDEECSLQLRTRVRLLDISADRARSSSRTCRCRLVRGQLAVRVGRRVVRADRPDSPACRVSQRAT